MSSSSDFLKNYELAEPTIRKLYDSKLRLAILDALKDEPLRLADLRRVVNANAPNTSSKAKELEELGLLERVDGDFQLTPYGRAVRQRLQESLEFYSTYEKFKKFWETRKTDGIPDFLWVRLGELNNSTLFTLKASDMNEVNEMFLQLLDSIKEKFYGVSPVYHPDWWPMTTKLARKGVAVDIPITKNVLKLIIRDATKEEVKFMDNLPNVKFSVIRDSVTVAFTVSESFLSLSLESKHSGFSLDMDLDSTDPHAIKWGMDLFEFYRKQSKPIKLSDYL